MTSPLDEKARDAALAAWFANTAQGWHAAMEAAIRVYLAASPSPSMEMEFTHVAKTKLDGLLADGWQVNGYSIQKDDRIGLVTTGAFVGWYSNACEAMNTAEAQVLRLTEENEALRKERTSLIETKREQIERLQSHWKLAEEQVAEQMVTLNSAGARIKALEEALSHALDHYDRNTCLHESVHRGGSIWTICDDCGRQWADDKGGFQPHVDPTEISAARTTLQKEQRAQT